MVAMAALHPTAAQRPTAVTATTPLDPCRILAHSQELRSLRMSETRGQGRVGWQVRVRVQATVRARARVRAQRQVRARRKPVRQIQRSVLEVRRIQVVERLPLTYPKRVPVRC
jgi:hypothetical protein